MNRRELLKLSGATLAGAAAGCVGTMPDSDGRPALRGDRVLRIAHITDAHVKPENGAADGLAACLHHIQSLRDRPDVIFNGGDAVMDVFEKGESEARVQWDLFRRIIRGENSLPVVHCIGNHDVWGWNLEKSGLTGREPRFGKQWACEVYEMDRTYRSFDLAGWHFVILDSTHPGGAWKYEARLDDEQHEWLSGDLASVKPQTPVMVLSHAPILAMCPFLFASPANTGDWAVRGSLLHLDARRLKGLFARHPNVRLCLSGHIHLVERTEYQGITYVCDGAVSAGWWRGPHQECRNGYGLIDLYADGRFDWQYVTFDWTARV